MDALGLTQQLSNYIIRPPRTTYNIEDLGQQTFEYKGVVYERIDFSVPPTKHTKKLQGSIYVQKHKERRPTLVYLHANSSSRMSIKNYLINLIAYFDVVTFDFRGCGLSEGAYLTLGFLEKFDIRAVIQYVQEKFGSRRYLLWGRSMGAVSAVLYTATYALYSDKIVALVLDSPFGNLQQVIQSLADKKVPLLPKFMVQSAIQNLQSHIKQIIEKQYNKVFLIRKHRPIEQISKIRIPIFFIGSKNDELVDCIHIQKLYDNAYCSRRQMEMLQGGHNQMRPEHLKVAVVQFLTAALSMKKQPVVRKKIFNFVPACNTKNAQEKNVELNQNKKITLECQQYKFDDSYNQFLKSRLIGRQRSKSRSPQKGRLFNGKSNPKIKEIMAKAKNGINKQEKLFILDNEKDEQKIPSNTGKRSYRIFSTPPNHQI